jgi:mitochondrial import inner membrane translocase subunit TIM50
LQDLSYLNRDLAKVIILDTNAQHVREQPENAIILPRWNGDPNDKGLVDLIPFLEYICTMEYDDVRKVLKSFEGTDIPVEFARREAIARAEFNKKRAVESRGSVTASARASGGLAGLGSLFGLNPNKMSLMVPVDGEQSPQEAMAQGKMLQDVARERGQRAYQLLEKEIRENGEKWLKEEAEAQKKAQEEAMSNMKTSFSGWFLGGGGAQKPVTETRA